jgi:hypothetical protein
LVAAIFHKKMRKALKALKILTTSASSALPRQPQWTKDIRTALIPSRAFLAQMMVAPENPLPRQICMNLAASSSANA